MILREAKPDLRIGSRRLALGGFAGWRAACIKKGVSKAALCIALILGPRLEANLRRGLLQKDGTLLLLGLTALSAAWPRISGAIVRDRAAQHQ